MQVRWSGCQHNRSSVTRTRHVHSLTQAAVKVCTTAYSNHSKKTEVGLQSPTGTWGRLTAFSTPLCVNGLKDQPALQKLVYTNQRPNRFSFFFVFSASILPYTTLPAIQLSNPSTTLEVDFNKPHEHENTHIDPSNHQPISNHVKSNPDPKLDPEQHRR
jgi:hypothetical protein